MKILCSGNPSHNTVASGVNKVFDDVDFASRATGYDLRFWDDGSEAHFCDKIKNYDIFINSSFICGWGQQQLLDVTFEIWEDMGVHGHIINIGSTSQWEGINSKFGSYTIQKKALQERSLQLNNKSNINTTHLIAGVINDGKPEHSDWIDPYRIAEIIKIVIDHPLSIPLISIV
jgi:hypothetical protein